MSERKAIDRGNIGALCKIEKAEALEIFRRVY
jgi:hypothetical protein